MSAKTSLPGYTGYTCKYQLEYPLNKAVPAHKYEDINPEKMTMKPRGRWVSNYYNTIEPTNIWDERPQEVDANNNLLSSFRRIKRTREELQKQRDKTDYESRPPSNWGTTYAGEFNGWKIDREYRKLAARSRTAPMENARAAADYRAVQAAPRAVLEGVDIPSSYSRSFGRRGQNPAQHYVPADGKAVFSRRATTKDLFSGSNKGTIRIPGYLGYKPESRNNVNSIRDNFPGFTKNNLIETYRYQMPGYTGKVKDMRQIREFSVK